MSPRNNLGSGKEVRPKRRQFFLHNSKKFARSRVRPPKPKPTNGDSDSAAEECERRREPCKDIANLLKNSVTPNKTNKNGSKTEFLGGRSTRSNPRGIKTRRRSPRLAEKRRVWYGSVHTLDDPELVDLVSDGDEEERVDLVSDEEEDRPLGTSTAVTPPPVSEEPEIETVIVDSPISSTTKEHEDLDLLRERYLHELESSDDEDEFEANFCQRTASKNFDLGSENSSDTSSEYDDVIWDTIRRNRSLRTRRLPPDSIFDGEEEISEFDVSSPSSNDNDHEVTTSSETPQISDCNENETTSSSSSSDVVGTQEVFNSFY